MKKALLLLFLFCAVSLQAFCQFSAVLSGNPLVTTGWNYGGNATVVDSTMRLTAATTTQTGYVYYNTVVNLTACAQFSVKFDFKIAPPAFGGDIADGIAFWYISNPPSGFITGGGIGLPTNPNGLILIMDTYDNDGNGNNPLETLLGYTGTTAGYTEGATTGVLGSVVPNQTFIDNGAWHHCEIDYNAGNINVYYNYSTTPSITAVYPLSISGYFGFSSSTGAAFSTQSIKNVYIDAAGIAATPGVTSPVSYCKNEAAAPLTATGAGPFRWYTTDTATVVSLPSAPTPSTTTVDTVMYYVRQGTGACISPPDSIKVIVKPLPPAPVVTGDTVYCTGATATALSATGAGTIEWYIVPTGGASTTIAPTVNTTLPGRHTYYAGELVNGCVGPRDSIKVNVYTTPPAPPLTAGGLEYCQNATVVPIAVSGTHILWYNTLTGGTGSSTAPTISTAVPGTFINYASQTDSGCTSARTTITVNVHPKPHIPVVNPPHNWCQLQIPSPASATPSAAGDHLLWYSGGIAGSSSAPTPSTTAAPDTVKYFVTETSSFGCVSDSAADQIIIIKKPAPPVTSDIAYCQRSRATALSAQVDSSANSSLNWYLNAIAIDSTPVPRTDTLPANYTWYVSQTVNTCESDSMPVKVTILYKPVFSILATQPWVCRFDSITLKYKGPQLITPSFAWALPEGASFANGSHVYDSSVTIKFDSAVTSNYVTLTATADSGKCSSDTSVRINIIPQPSAQATTRADVCLGDTVALALNAVANNAATYSWAVDNVSLFSSNAVSLVRTNSHSGGPYSIAWIDSGRHIVEVTAFTQEGCKAEPFFDTINVHTSPVATFKITSKDMGECLGDSVQFLADAADYANRYQWSPEGSFENINSPSAWGRVFQQHTIIALTVTDPFGCKASTSMEVDPGSCCTVGMPNAFTPNGDTRNNFFRPLYNGYHHFHAFRIVNRWGQVVFNSENSNMQWDGNWNGVPQDMGIYYYYLKYDCGGKTMEQKGDVTLIR